MMGNLLAASWQIVLRARESLLQTSLSQVR
jgi:hypothetical protein